MPRLANILLPLFGTYLLSQGSNADYLSNARTAANKLLDWYDQDTGLFNTTGWWNGACAITTLIEMQSIDKESNFENFIENTFEINKNSFEKSGFYDDEGWWALTWIKAYDLTKNRDYLQAAEDLFNDMSGGWETNCNGGIWWDKQHTYVNAIANELFLSVAAHLARRTWNIEYLNWAIKQWEWFEHSGLINAEHNINDGLNGACQNNGYNVWTYNQGVIVGALVELSHATFDASYISTASQIAWAGIHNLTDSNGVLHDPCEAGCGGDVSQFKGIFMANVQSLYTATHDQGLKHFLQENANSIWTNDRSSDDELGILWSGPSEDADASTHSSALFALIAAAAVQ